MNEPAFENSAARDEARATKPVDRLPPHSPEAEAGVLGCELLAPEESIGAVVERLKGDVTSAFYDLRHQLIQSALVEMFTAKTPIDVITLQQFLKDRGNLEQAGSINYLVALANLVPSAANLETYLAYVWEKNLLRKWIATCTEIVQRAYDFSGDVDELVAQVSGQLFKLCERDQQATEKSMREVVLEVHEKYLDKFQRGVKFNIGPMTGFNYLDNILPGLGAGQLIIIAARPRTGKSAIMMQMVEHIAMVEKIPVGVISLEMTAASLGAREVFQRAGADITKFMNGFMSDADVQKLTASSTQLSRLGIFIDESSRMSIEELEIRARRLVRRHHLGVLFVDYFQLLYARQRNKQWSKSDELAECSIRLKALSKELRIPIVLLAQMNREIEREVHRRPRLADLRDTGQLEQDADVIMFLWKPDVKSETWQKRVGEILPRVPVPEEWKLPRTWKRNLAIVTCTVEKQREGRSGEDATLVFIKPWTRFVDAYRPGKEAGEPAEEETISDDDIPAEV